MKRLFTLFVFVLLLSSQETHAASSSSAAPAGDPSSLCTNEMNARLGQEQRLYRAVLFGRQKAEDEKTGNTRYDTEGNPWLKVDKNKWVSDSPGFGSVMWSNYQMDLQTEWEGFGDKFADPSWKNRPGIFATKGAATSELVAPLTQSFRAFQCRAAAVCEAAAASMRNEKPDADGFITVQVSGCVPIRMKLLTSCQRDSEGLGAAGGPALSVTTDFLPRVVCEPVMDQMLNREAELLKLATSYDAAYRSLLQFAGSFDEFTNRFGGDLLEPIRQSMSLLSQLSRIPCFLSQCNE